MNDVIRHHNAMVLTGDCLSILPTLVSSTVGLVYTDPPYEMNYKSSIPGNAQWNSGSSSSRFDSPILNDVQGSIEWKAVWTECYRVLQDDRYIVIHGNFPFLSRQLPILEQVGFRYKGIICWNKKSAIGGDIRGALKRDWEPILYMAKGTPNTNPVKVLRDDAVVTRNRISEIADWEFSIMREQRWGHPTQKPVDLASRLMRVFSSVSDTVLDPFAGSGTTAVACLRRGQSSYSIEMDTKYIEIIQGRLGHETGI